VSERASRRAHAASDLVEQILSKIPDGVEATVRIRRADSALTRFATSFIHQNVAEDATEVVVAVNIDGRSAVAATTDVRDEGLRRLVTGAVDAARLRPPDPLWPGLPTAIDPPAVDHWADATAEADPDARADVVRAFVDAAGGLETAGFCSTGAGHVWLGNTAGLRVGGRSTSAVIDGVARAPGADGSGGQVSASLADLDGAAVGRIAGDKARAAAEGGVDLEPGHYEVVLEPKCVASILDFLSYLGFNGKVHNEGRSFAHVGEEQFDTNVEMWDDVLDRRAIGIGFDAEGTAKRRLDLVKAGRTLGLAYDRRSAAEAGTESTGHFTGQEAIGPMATNVFLGGGSSSREELIASIDRGVLVTEFWYLRPLDPKTLVVTGLTRNGVFLIEGGRITKPVSNLRFTQSFVAALGPGNVAALGNDGQLATGDLTAMSGGGHFVPSLHLRSWNFTGGAAG
jgi:predicted Zn-dependent protease